MATVIRVLLADDLAAHRSVLKASLRTVGPDLGVEFDIKGEAEDGQQLLNLYSQAAPGAIDLIFSDILMPVMDGLSALVKIRQLSPTQKIVMASSEDLKTIDTANTKLGETARKTVEQTQRMDLLNKVAERIRKGQTEEGKTNSILTGCEKLALDPIWVAEQYGANGYLRKPYDVAKSKELIQHVLQTASIQFLAKV